MGHAVACDMLIAADEFKSLVPGLGDQQAVERVAVVIAAGFRRPGRGGW